MRLSRAGLVLDLTKVLVAGGNGFLPTVEVLNIDESAGFESRSYYDKEESCLGSNNANLVLDAVGALVVYIHKL